MDLRYIVQWGVGVLFPDWRQAASNTTINVLDKNVWCTIGRKLRPLLWYCMKFWLTCISAENIKGLILCLASHCVQLLFLRFTSQPGSECGLHVMLIVDECPQVCFWGIAAGNDDDWWSEWSNFRDVNLRSSYRLVRLFKNRVKWSCWWDRGLGDGGAWCSTSHRAHVISLHHAHTWLWEMTLWLVWFMFHSVYHMKK